MVSSQKARSPAVKSVFALSIAAAFGLPAPVFAAAGDPKGPPILAAVNQFFGARAQISSAADGRFVVASLVTPPNCQVCTQSVSVQRFNADGTPAGSAIVLTTPSSNSTPVNVQVAMAADGDFVATYDEYRGLGTHIHAASFAADGTPRSGNVEVANVIPLGRRGRAYSNVAIDSQGDFTIAWHTLNTFLEIDNPYGLPISYQTHDTITARRFRADGTALTRAVTVDSESGRSGSNPRGDRQRNLQPLIASDGAGNFTVGWIQVTNGISYAVKLRSYSAQAVALGNPVQANTDPAISALQMSLTMNTAGRFAAAWLTGPVPVVARSFLASGTPDGAPFAVADDLPRHQAFATTDVSLSIDAVGDLAVTSDLASFADHPTAPNGVFVRRFTSAGTPRGPSILVVPIDISTTIPDVASDASGNFAVVYTGNAQPVPGAILVQRYKGP